MKSFFMIFTLIIFSFSSSIFIQAQNNDQVSGLEPIVVPENIQSLIQQVNNAENNENWEEYATLRQELIQAWQQVNPEVANLYRNVNDGTPDLTPDGMPSTHPRTNIVEPTESDLFETPSQSNNALWGTDVMITSGRAYDFSMDISRDDDIYLAVVGRLDGSTTKDSVYIYKSTDGGASWVQWSSIFASTRTFDKVELMCFDGFPGSSGDSYVLLFFLFDNGWLRVGRTLTSTPSFDYFTLTGGVGGGFTTDFAVDRNYPGSNYRAICLYDSATVVKSIRSEPTSNGTVWQDAVSLGLVGRDLDLCYGFTGSTYASFNGNSSGNLYVFENLNSGDPASWGTSTTLVTGSTDTTRHVEIIASRETAPNNIVALLFELRSGSTYDIFQILRPSGGSWGSMSAWVTTREDKWPALYSRKVNGNQVFPGVFEQSENGNGAPRTIRYKAYNGTSWSTSVQVSDDGIDVTGLQKPEVGELAGDVPVFAYSGANFTGVYFDNFSWTPVGVEDDIQSQIPTEFNLFQNYPNPFNPTTIIKFNIPEASSVTLKIYDVLGNEVSNIVNEQLDAGQYEYNFNAQNHSSGVYFYKIEAVPSNGEASFVQTKKMILMK